jgi:hypothetical protein
MPAAAGDVALPFTQHARFDEHAEVDPSEWRLQILESIRDIDAASWDEVAGPHAASRSHAYLAAVEASGINDCRYFYPAIHDAANRLVAHACVYTITTDFLQMLPESLRGPASWLRRLWPGFLRVRVTECASPLIAGHSISIREGLERGPLIRRLGRAVGEIARAEGSRLMVVRDFLAHDHADFDALLADGYNLTSNMPLARIHVRWKTYAEYLASMRSRYRKDLKRRLDRVERGGQRAVRLSAFAGQAALWAEQVAVMYERTKGFKRERIGRRYYEEMGCLPAERCMLVAAEREGRHVAHGMVLFDDTNTIATYFGRDAGPPGNEWFQLLNEVIRIGIERGSSHICLGLGSYDAKSLLGADIEALHVYSRSTLAPVNWLMRLVPHTMARQQGRPARRIFRDEHTPVG